MPITPLDLAERSLAGLRLNPAERQRLVALVPARSQPYMSALFRVEDDALGHVSALLLWAIMEAETLSGTAKSLDCPGPGGTGDHASRDSAIWGTAKPPDGRGWGRGLFQIDFGAHETWLATHDWTDPYVSASKAAELLAGNSDYFRHAVKRPGIKVRNVIIGGPNAEVPDVRPLVGMPAFAAMIAAYNARRGDVLLALGRGQDPDTPTYPYKVSKGAKGYARSVLAAIATIGAQL